MGVDPLLGGLDPRFTLLAGEAQFVAASLAGQRPLRVLGDLLAGAPRLSIDHLLRARSDPLADLVGHLPGDLDAGRRKLRFSPFELRAERFAHGLLGGERCSATSALRPSRCV